CPGSGSCPGSGPSASASGSSSAGAAGSPKTSEGGCGRGAGWAAPCFCSRDGTAAGPHRLSAAARLPARACWAEPCGPPSCSGSSWSSRRAPAAARVARSAVRWAWWLSVQSRSGSRSTGRHHSSTNPLWVASASTCPAHHASVPTLARSSRVSTALTCSSLVNAASASATVRGSGQLSPSRASVSSCSGGTARASDSTRSHVPPTQATVRQYSVTVCGLSEVEPAAGSVEVPFSQLLDLRAAGFVVQPARDGAAGGLGGAAPGRGRGEGFGELGGQPVAGGPAVAQLGTELGGRDGEHAVDQARAEAVEDAGALLLGEPLAGGQVDRELDPAVGGVHALAAGAGGAGEAPGQVPGRDRHAAADGEGPGHRFGARVASVLGCVHGINCAARS